MRILAFLSMLTGISVASAQQLPPSMHFSESDHTLYTGKQAPTGFYDEGSVKTFQLWFSQTGYWQQLATNYATHTDLPATLVVENDTFYAVGVRFKGQTSYSMVQNADKKSFNITLDYTYPEQNIEGYNTFNLNNAFEDASFMREFLYLHQIRQHVPAAKCAYVHLYINGQDWGLYPNVQQLDGNYISDWFFSNDGTRWRADRPEGTTGGPGGGGGPGWGDGTAALNDLGADSTEYKKYYTLKSTNKTNPWEDLIRVCDVLNSTVPDSLEAKISQVMDLDRTLWFLASEIAFSDDDSYVYKGKMDYYLYWDVETNWMVPLEFDGNSAFKSNATNWSPFYNANKVNYPLLNRLLAVPSIRQRYLAHFRTLVADEMEQSAFDALVAQTDALIKPLVSSDPKKLYTISAYETQKNGLKTFVQNHRNTINADSEIAQIPPVISDVSLETTGGTWVSPEANMPATVRATATHGSGLAALYLYYSPNLQGAFSKTTLLDDGQHNDLAANDGVFGGEIPGFDNGKAVRFYVEALANNTAKTRTYAPKGAEHDVYYYRVGAIWANERPIAINEVMASNSSTQADEAGEYDDWIELYNLTDETVSLDGYSISDNLGNPQKWVFPAGSSIAPHAYQIIWADEDQTQGDWHCNFKLSANGESLALFNSEKRLVDTVSFQNLGTDQGYARVPNGTGPFVLKTPTFAANNGTVATSTAQRWDIRAWPNPASTQLRLQGTALQGLDAPVRVFDSMGRLVTHVQAADGLEIDCSAWPKGTYLVQIADWQQKIMVQ